jgi:prefoldin beta subunit
MADMQAVQETEQRLHAFLAQRSALLSQKAEAEHALSQLSGAEESYRIVGTIMVKRNPEQVRQELEERRGSVESRIAGLDKHVESLRAELARLQEEILGEKNGKVRQG